MCNMANFKGSKDRLEECQPSSEFLFGSKLKELAKALKDEAHFKGKSTFRDRLSKFPKGGRKEFGGSGKAENRSGYNKSGFNKSGKFQKKKKE